MTDPQDEPTEPVKRKHRKTVEVVQPREEGVVVKRSRTSLATGRSRPRKVGGVDWRNDLNIQKRLAMLSRFTSMGWVDEPLYQQLQAWLLSQGQPSTTWDTFRLDQRRLVTLLKEFPAVTAEEIAASVRATKQEAWKQALNPRTHPSVQAGSLRVVNESDLLLARLGGILDDRAQVKVAVQVVNTPIPFAPGSEDVGRKALEMMRFLNPGISPGEPKRLESGDEDE